TVSSSSVADSPRASSNGRPWAGGSAWAGAWPELAVGVVVGRGVPHPAATRGRASAAAGQRRSIGGRVGGRGLQRTTAAVYWPDGRPAALRAPATAASGWRTDRARRTRSSRGRRSPPPPGGG